MSPGCSRRAKWGTRRRHEDNGSDEDANGWEDCTHDNIFTVRGRHGRTITSRRRGFTTKANGRVARVFDGGWAEGATTTDDGARPKEVLRGGWGEENAAKNEGGFIRD